MPVIADVCQAHIKK